MNKLLSVASAIGMLTAVSTAQAAEVITDEQMDTITAGAYAGVSASVQGAYTNYGSFYFYVNNTSPTEGYAYASIYSDVTPQGNAPYTLSLSASVAASGISASVAASGIVWHAAGGVGASVTSGWRPWDRVMGSTRDARAAAALRAR